MAYKPILSLDFDGVLHSYESGWKGVDVILDPPVPGAKEFIIAASEYFDIFVYSSRSNCASGIRAMMDYMEKHMGQDVLHKLTFTDYKPSAFITIDDRAITFNGQWPDIQAMLNFKPWNKK